MKPSTPLRTKTYTLLHSGKSAEGKQLLLSGRRLERTDFSEDDQERFWSQVTKTSEECCWMWNGCKDRRGYGKFKVSRRPLVASRVSYAIHFGIADKGMMICHKCDNPSCVNPNHLFEGTVLDNNKDALVKKRNATGEGHNFAKLTESQVIQMRKEWSEVHHDTWADIGRKYGISAKMAKFIILRRNWRRVP